MYKKGRHSCYDLEYHLVVVTKFRHKVITGALEDRLIELTQNLMEQWKCDLHSVECNEDHVHILFSAPPQVCLSRLVNNYKTVTARYLRQEFMKELRPYYWKKYFWSQSYFIGSVSERTHDAVRKYIETQKEDQ